MADIQTPWLTNENIILATHHFPLSTDVRRELALSEAICDIDVCEFDPELIANGGPFADTTGWTAFFTSVLSVQGDELRCANDAVSTDPGRGVASIATEVGESYRITCARSSDVGQAATMLVFASNNSDGSSPFLDEQTIAIGAEGFAQFVATATTTFVGFRHSVSTADVYVQIVSIGAKRTT